MRPNEHDAGYLLDMLHHARGVEEAVRYRKFDEYVGDENLRLVLERRIEIIGEAASRISNDFQEAHPDIPWRMIVAQRNVLAHQYGEIDDEILWQVATVSIPELISLLEPLTPIPPNDDDG